MLSRIWRKGNTFALLVGMQTGVATLENSMEALQKIKNRATLRPNNCTTRNLSKGYKDADSKGHMQPNVYSSPLADEWIKKMCVCVCVCVCMHTHTHNGISLGDQKE